MTAKETATFLNLSEPHVYRLLRDQRIKGKQDANGRWIVTEEAATTYLQSKGKKRTGRKVVLVRPCVEQLPALALFCTLHNIPFNRNGYYKKVA